MNIEEDYDLSRVSDPISIVDYRPGWRDEFAQIGRSLRALLGDAALRIDHVGSTSVPHLAAKDIIDLQISVADLTRAQPLVARLESAGYRLQSDISSDVFVGVGGEQQEEWVKHYLREPDGARRANIHVRQAGRLNQRYALLFRDYLRYDESVRRSYETIKRRLAHLFPRSIDGYLFIKDPVMDLIYAGAESWARASAWAPSADYL